MKSFRWPARQVWMACGSLGLLALGTTSRAQDDWLAEFTDPRNYGYLFRAGPRVLYNVKASVSRLDSSVQTGVYDNGFVLPDVGGAASGRTWNWGYEESAQVAGSQMRMSRQRGEAMAGLFQDESNPSLGGEIMGGTEFGRFNIGKREARFGFEMGYAYNHFAFSQKSTASSIASLTAAAYTLGATPPPTAPYSGTFNGPGPTIDLLPVVSSSLSSPSQATFDGEIESDLHNFRAGFWFEYPLARPLTANLSLGYSSLYGDTQLQYTESLSYDNPAFADMPLTHKTVGGRDWRPGAYLQLRLNYEFNRHFGVYVGGDYAYQSNLEFKGEGRKVTLGFHSLLAASGGLVFSF